MTFKHPSQGVLSAGLLSLSAFLLVSCSVTEEAPLSAESGSAAETTVISGDPSGAVRPSEELAASEAIPEPPGVLPGEGDGSVNHGTNPLIEGERVAVEPDAVSFQVEPAEGLTVTSGMVTIHWAAAAGGAPITADDCSGILTIVAPGGLILTVEPEITSCHGSTGILLSEATEAPPGNYVVSVMLNSVSGEQTISVAAGA